jgi:hypothetical protein
LVSLLFFVFFFNIILFIYLLIYFYSKLATIVPTNYIGIHMQMQQSLVYQLIYIKAIYNILLCNMNGIVWRVDECNFFFFFRNFT